MVFNASVFLRAKRITAAITVPPAELTKNGSMYVHSTASFPISRAAIGYAQIPPRTDVPNSSPIHVKGMFLEYLYTSPQSSAPHMLPGNASKVPVPIKTLIRDVTNAIPTP